MTTVLAVDDDPVILRLLQVNLEMEGYDVVLASDGQAALDQARAHLPAIVLLDVMMPEKNGWEVCEEMKKDAALAKIPVIFLSARAQDTDVDKGVELGAESYITKPFDPIDLLDLIAEILADQAG